MPRLLQKRSWALLIAVAIAGLVATWWFARGEPPTSSVATAPETAAGARATAGSADSPSANGSAGGKAHAEATARPADVPPEPEAPVESAPVPVQVYGRVTNQGGQPAAAVDVIFSSKGAESTATSDDTGSYSLHLLPGSYRVRAIGERVIAVGLAPLELGSTARRLDLRVQQQSVIRGRVRYRDRSPAVGAVVVPHRDRKKRSELAALGELGTAEVQDDGSFELFTVPGDLVVDATVRSAAGRTRVHALAPGETRNNVNITLVPNGYVEGVVRGPDDEVIGDAKVLASMQIPGTGEYDRIPVSTDARGRFRYQVLRPARTIIEASARGYAQSKPIAFQLEPGESRTNLVLELRKADLSLSGHVVDQAGHPLALVQVAQGVVGSKERYKKTFTNADGYFIISDLAPGPHRLRFRRSGYEQVRKTGIEAPSSNILVTMPRVGARTQSDK